MITLFGATGYTGQLIAHALSRAALPFRIGGRSQEKLEALSASLPGRPAWITADVTKPATLPPLFHDTRLLINAAGPFTDLGERVAALAAMGGVHYLDITNELGYVYRLRSYDQMARRSGAAIVPACAFEVSLADCAAHLVGKRLLDSVPADESSVPADESSGKKPGQIDAIQVVYDISGQGASAGTRRSAVRSLATSWIAYRDGMWTGAIPGGQVRAFNLPAGNRYALRYALSIPSSETVTVPAHLPAQRVDTWMCAAPTARLWAPVLVPLFARLSRSILRPLFLRLASNTQLSAEKALDEGLRAGSAFSIYVSARRQEQSRWLALTGKDPYGLTAEIIAYAARQMTREDYRCSGLLAPAQALDPAAFLKFAVENWGITLIERD